MSVVTLFRRRWDEFLQVVVSLLVLLGAARLLVSAGSIGWKNGVLFAIADALATILPGNVDVPVALLTGVVAGWFLLFALDVTKRVQTLALIVVAAVVAVWLRRLEHVVDASGREPGYFLAAMVFTVAITAVTTERLRTSPDADAVGRNSVLRMVRLLQFPGASRGLFALLSALIVVVTVQYPWMPRTPEDPSVLLVGVSGLVAIVALGSFVQYRSRANVVALTPAGPLGTAAEVYAFAGLYYVAKRDYNGSPTDEASAHALEDAISRPDEWIERGFDEPVQFAYLPESLLRRTVEIHSVEHRLSALAESEIAALAAAGGLQDALARLRRGVKRGIRRLLPLSAVSDIRLASSAVEIVDMADIVLLIFPYPDEEPAGEHVERMAGLLDTFVNDVSLPAKLIVTHADRADIATDDVEFGSGDHRDRLLVELNELLTDPAEDQSAVARIQSDFTLFETVYPVADKPPHADEMKGYDRILDELDRR